MFRRLIPDKFILWLIAAILLACILPVSAAPAQAVSVITAVAIFALFFLHGVRLPREALLAGFADWRLHGAILGITFGLFPLIGLNLEGLFPQLLEPMLWTGFLFLCVVPSTVQSSIAYTSMARGNVAGAVAAAAFSNMAGVFLTPLLASLLLQAQGAISLTGISRIFLLLFLPFLLGHALRPWLLRHVEKRPALTTIVDKGTILLAVYGAFSAAVVDRIWSRVPPHEIAILIALCLLLLAMILGGGYLIGRLGRFPYGSRCAILFCGSVKSLASGAPMALILFPGADGALIIVPVMLYHTLQLIVCASIAGSLSRRRRTEEATTAPA